MRRTAALIVGGGPAGAAAAIVLAAQGHRPLLVERRSVVDDALCGGFLSWRSLRTLAALGIDADALNPDRIRRVRILVGDRCAEAALPAPAVAVSRRRLDALLLDRAVATGALVERGVTVRRIAAGSVEADGVPIATDALFLASGKGDVRGTARPADARGSDPTLGLRLRLAPHPELHRLVGDAVELHPFRGGYVGVAVQEDGSVNLCMAVRRSRLRIAGTPAALLTALAAEAPQLADRLAHADPGGRIDAVANIPYGWRATTGTPGLFRLGDQAGVIPSLAGEGMGIALATGRSAASAWLRDGGAASEQWQAQTARALFRPIGIAGLIRRLAEGTGAGWLARSPAALIQMGATLTRFAP